MTTKFLVHRDAREGVDYDLDHLTRVWNVTNDEDKALVQTISQEVRARIQDNLHEMVASRKSVWFG